MASDYLMWLLSIIYQKRKVQTRTFIGLFDFMSVDPHFMDPHFILLEQMVTVPSRFLCQMVIT